MEGCRQLAPLGGRVNAVDALDAGMVGERLLVEVGCVSAPLVAELVLFEEAVDGVLRGMGGEGDGV